MDESVKFHARDFLSVKQEDLLADYELGDVLGEGGFGLVYSCIHRATGSERAVKMLKKDPRYPHIQDNILNEFNVLKDLDHPVSCCSRMSCVVKMRAGGCTGIFCEILLVNQPKIAVVHEDTIVLSDTAQ
jgi:serine/threonine protein kinase